MRLVFWTNYPSHQVAGLCEALHKWTSGGVTVIHTRELEQSRRRLGWEPIAASFPCVALWQSPGKALGLLGDARVIHLFGGVWGEKTLAALALWCARTKVRFGLVQEPSFPGRSSLKRACKRIIAGRLAPRAVGVFAISRRAESEMRDYGFPEDRIWSFGYFRESPERGERIRAEASDIVLYLGQFTERKGINLLLSAWEVMRGSGLKLRLVGGGEMSESVRAWIETRGFGDQVELARPVSPDAVWEELSRARVLVLPSRHDGWGVVVNEALSVGVPVVASSAAGSSELVTSSGAGCVFQSENKESLCRSLLGTLSPESILSWSENAFRFRGRIHPETAARYMLGCLSSPGSPPPPPWRGSCAA